MSGRGSRDSQPPTSTPRPALALWRRRIAAGALVVSAILLGRLAFFRLGDAVPKLLRGGPAVADGPDDLLHRHIEIHAWFAGQPVYGQVGRATYPPAAYPVLWPFAGWLDLKDSRILWAATSIAALAVLGWIGVRQGHARGPPQAAVIALFLAATSPVAVTIAVGQLSIHLLLAAVGGVLLLGRGAGPSNGTSDVPPRLSTDLAAAILIAVALIKPNSAVPFLLVAGAVARRLRPVVLIGAIYLFFTLVADAFQSADIGTLMSQWLEMIRRRVHYGWGRANLHLWLDAVPLRQWRMPASLLALVALGVWTWRNRRADLWVLMGVAAIVTRLWAHHRFYDDVLLWIPAVALLRFVNRPPDGLLGATFRLLLLGLLAGPLLLPYEFYGKRGTEAPVLEWAQVVTWIVVMGYLAWQGPKWVGGETAAAKGNPPATPHPSRR